MKLLLTSGGVTNDSIRAALEGLLGKPIDEADALFIPTAQWGHPMCSPASVYRSIVGRGEDWLTNLGWRSLGVLELTALPSIGRERWEPWVRDADVLFVDGGEAVYLADWMRESGLADLLPELDSVWVGVSAGSMALTPRIGEHFVERRPGEGDATLGVVDFSIFPHLEYPGWSENTRDVAAQWAHDLLSEPGMPSTAYALDDASAIVVDGDRVEVVSEGEWAVFGPGV
ncbi:Type 1 glutamine amidotransferase-like domain-containing protein [Microbacterium sp. bgisy203]|uniref:Type 1 glutamine amidotransferase-like domain-containing protein n=1 Tax=Microbacterium sp. bgisy203 TaxID=3413799 RepID=UPI003D71BB4F